MSQIRTSTKTRRAVVSAAAAGLGAVALAACGQEAGGSPSTPSQATGQITFLGRESGSEVAVYKEAIEKFNASQPRVKVTHDLATGNFDQKLQTVVAAGTAPDANYMHSQTVPTYVSLGVAAPLDAHAKKDKAVLDGLLPAAVDSYRFKNEVYGIADVATSYVMYINPALFRKAGATLPTEKWTWSDYTTAAQRIVSALRGEEVFGVANWNAADSWPSVLWQNGADILNKDRNAVTIDRPEAIEAFTWIADQVQKAKLHPAPADMAGKSAEQMFFDGKAAMIPTYSSRAGTIAKTAQFEVEAVHLPAGKQRVNRTACGGVAMGKASKAPDATWEFLKYIAGEEFQWSMARVGGIIFPGHKKVANSPELFATGAFPKNSKVVVDAIGYARIEPYTVRYLDMKGVLGTELNKVWTGESGVRDAMVRAKGVMEPILAEAVAAAK